jgi:hypothetical protein
MKFFNLFHKQKPIEPTLDEYLYQRMKDLGFEGKEGLSIYSNPTKDLGDAINWAKKYNLELFGKTAFNICADLDKKFWKSKINPTICQWAYGRLLQQPLDEINSINGFGRSVQEAVCRCLINARIAGVI